MLAVIFGLAALTLGTSPSAVLAQEGDETGRSLCEALSAEDLSELLGAQYQAQPGFAYCSWNLTSPFSVSAGWQSGTLEDSKQFWTPGEDVTVGDRPGWLATELGTLLIGLDDGVIVLTAPGVDTQSEDAAARILQLGERLVANSAAIVAPAPPEPIDIDIPAADPDLEALFPATVGDQPLTVQTMAGEVLLMSGEETLQPLEDALAAQGLTVSDLSIGFAGTADSTTTMQAMRVKGGDAQALLPILVEMTAQGAVASETEIAGKPVTVVESPAGTQYIYASGEVVWLVMGAEPALSEIIAALP
jgi:hypothetical protein